MNDNTYEARIDSLLASTTPADDIDMLFNLYCQACDEGEVDGVTTQIPDPTEHCKRWEEVSFKTLMLALERKYKNAPRLKIPEENMTSY